MLTVGIVSQKGGVGKTTLAFNLAVAAELAGNAALIVDLDPQASAVAWGDSREAETPAVVSAEAARLVEVLATANKHSAALCFIDTAPHGESPALAAARAADLVLIPCRPSILDLRAITASQTIVQLADTPAAVVLYGVPASGSLAKEAQTALQTHGPGRAAAIGTALLGCGDPLGLTFLAQVGLELGKDAEHVEECLAGSG